VTNVSNSPAPAHHAAPWLTLEDIERVAGIVWQWIGDLVVKLAAEWRDAAVPGPVEVWMRAVDNEVYGADLTLAALMDLRMEHLERQAGSLSYPVVALESSLLRPQVMAGLEGTR